MKYIYNLKFIVLTSAVITFFIGCRKDDLKEERTHEKMVLVYLAGNNNLKDEAIESIVKMQRGVKGIKGDLLAFVKTERSTSQLLRIKYSNGDKVVSDTLKNYGFENSSDPSFLSRVIHDARKLSAAKTYGLVLWSHATAWAPPYNRVTTKSFGDDDGIEMDIVDLKKVLPNDFEYIMFDACSMGSVEVIFELRNNTKYILASPSEVLSTGFPYEEITKDLFNGLDGLKVVSKKFIDHYNSLSGLFASATVSLIDTKELDGVAMFTRELLSKIGPKKGFELNKLQRLDYQYGSGVPAYDFISFFKNNFPTDSYSVLLKEQVNKAVIYSGHTEQFFNIPIKEFCGLSVYLPDVNIHHEDYYKQLDWDKATGWSTIFKFSSF